MPIENNIYFNFKSYRQYQNAARKTKSPEKQEKNLKPIIGSALGVAGALAVTSAIPKKNTTFDEVARMLMMAGAANVGGVLGGSINASKEAKEKKWHEAGFQMMNTTIPMLMVSGALETCKKVKALNNKPAKIIASFSAMITGAAMATQITNLSKEDHEPKRKYTLKDSVANFDDIVATIAIGFKDVLKYVPVDKILPFIYAYCGARAGEKE